MGRRIHADADGPGWRQLATRREADRDYLATLRALVTARDTDTLSRIVTNYAGGPAWRRIAAERSLAKVASEAPPTSRRRRR